MIETKEKLECAFRKDNELIHAFCSGERRAFDDLVMKHKDKMFNLCYLFLGDYQEADDIAQEIFIKVYRSLDKFRFESAFSTWLYRITVNTCKNRLKSLDYRYKKWMYCLDAGNPSHNHNNPVELSDKSDSPLSELENKERTKLINKAINSLSKDKKTVTILRDIEGLSYEEIARVTGLNQGTVKSKLARARMDLRKKLDGVL
jgi:RNA polymerase sigma-70 factor (ECF subfamily)